MTVLPFGEAGRGKRSKVSDAGTGGTPVPSPGRPKLYTLVARGRRDKGLRYLFNAVDNKDAYKQAGEICKAKRVRFVAVFSGHMGHAERIGDAKPVRIPQRREHMSSGETYPVPVAQCKHPQGERISFVCETSFHGRMRWEVCVACGCWRWVEVGKESALWWSDEVRVSKPYGGVPDCDHKPEAVLPGPRTPARFGTWATQLCGDCGAWRPLPHGTPEAWRWGAYSEREEDA